MNQVDNELVQELIVTFVPDQTLHARLNSILLKDKKSISFIVTSSGINDRHMPRTTPRLVIVVNI
jgi:hypothetical protein